MFASVSYVLHRVAHGSGQEVVKDTNDDYFKQDLPCAFSFWHEVVTWHQNMLNKDFFQPSPMFIATVFWFWRL